MALTSDYANIMNQNMLNYANGLLSANNNKIAGMDAGLISQRNMLGANSAAYRKLLEAQETGELKRDKHDSTLLSDKFFNDYFDNKTGKLKKATYTPDPTTTATLDKEATAADNLDSMRRLALAAISNPNSLSAVHYDMFEKMRQSIANGLVTSGSSSGSDNLVTVEDAKAATVEAKVGNFYLLTDDQNITVSGSGGDMNYNFKAGDSLQSIVSKINADSKTTGVKAELNKNDDGDYVISFMSTDTGKDSTVKVIQNVGELFTANGGQLSANGTDAVTQKGEVVATSEQTTAAVAVGVYSGKILGDQSFTVSGARGSQEYSFASGTDVNEIVSAINSNVEATGVMAEVIYNAAGEAEGIGFIADKSGSGQFVKIEQTAGDLFGKAGSAVKVAGSGTADSGAPAISSLSDLGKVVVNNITYSFADLTTSASLAKNPDVALAVIDQALKDIYEGRAQIKGFDPAEHPILGMSGSTTSDTNTAEIGNFGSNALKQWLSAYQPAD